MNLNKSSGDYLILIKCLQGKKKLDLGQLKLLTGKNRVKTVINLNKTALQTRQTENV